MVKITFLGDIMCKREQLCAVQRTGRSFDDAFVGIRELLLDSDYVVGNLETPLAGEEAKYSYRPAEFNTPDAFAVALKKIGINFVTTANNHCLDRGIDGLKRTLDALDAAGIAHTGTYRSVEESAHLAIIELKGVKVSLLASTYGTNSEHHMPLLKENEFWAVDMLKLQEPWRTAPGTTKLIDLKRKLLSLMPIRARDALLVLKNGLPKESPRDFTVDNVPPDVIEDERHNARLAAQLKKVLVAKSKSDIVIALPHVGGQYNPHPGEYAKYIVGSFVKTGVDAVVANHSHNPLNFELRGAVPIAYSLGNFASTPYVDWYVYGSLADYSVVLNAYVDECTRSFAKFTYSIVKNVRQEDGFTYTVPAVRHLKGLRNRTERERVEVEMQAVARRFSGNYLQDLFVGEYDI